MPQQKNYSKLLNGWLKLDRLFKSKNTNKLKKLLFKIYWEQIALPINYLIYLFKFTILKRHKRSSQSLITPTKKTFDTNGQMQRLEQGRDDMEEFVKIVPDQCLIELSEKIYCGN